jgi:branched-chain amino acid transport system permease protein
MAVVWSGLATGSVFALVAAGYNIFFVASGGFNFAHAQLLMLGVFLAEWGLVVAKLPIAVTFGFVAVSICLVGVIEERLAVRPTKDLDTLLITTVGASSVIGGVVQLIWGGQVLEVPIYSANTRSLLNGALPIAELWLIVTAVVMTVLLVVAIRRTRVGLALLAIAENREAALLRGINVPLLSFAAFAFSGLTAGLVAPVVGAETFASGSLATSLALTGFVALTIGGFGSFGGSLLGGLIVGLVGAEAEYWIGVQYSNLCIFGVLIAVLLVRPTGLFVSARERVV